MEVTCFWIITILVLSDGFGQKTKRGEPDHVLENTNEDRFVFEKLSKLVPCTDKKLSKTAEMRGKFWVFYNFVQPEYLSRCHESITYTTHADFSFLDNLVPLVERWNGPISLAVYAPGTDFLVSLRSIAFLRTCRSLLVKKFVNFHVFFDVGHFPPKVFDSLLKSYNDNIDCRRGPPFKTKKSYRFSKNLTYPINVARNIARQSTQTHFVFASDIELYPSQGFIYKFLRMMANNPNIQLRVKPKVFVAPVFELLEHANIPRNKTELQELLRNNTALLFHHNICPMCHRVPEMNTWKKMNETDSYNVMVIAKRTKQFKHWEPFYVGTRIDPLFDERLTWEGQSNKITQAFSMCLLDYDYMVLDNAFLVHRPGLKKAKDQIVKFSKIISKTNHLLRNVIQPELLKIYGKRKECGL